MFSLAKILAPVDLSKRSPGGARYAGLLAGHFGSELTLLHVLDSSVYGLSAHEAADPAISKLCDGWRSRTETLLANFLPGEFPGIRVRRIVSSGPPAEDIIHFV